MMEKSCTFSTTMFSSVLGVKIQGTPLQKFFTKSSNGSVSELSLTTRSMLNAGNIISPTLSKAIVESTVLIVVLSENYASSTWCLQELVEILNCLKKGNQQLVYPIFYHVDPSHVRHQKGKYGEAMTAHENRFGKNSDQVRQWRSALNEVCQLVGLHISTTGDEINDVEKIVEKVYAKIISKPLQGKDPIGFEQRIQDLKSLLDIKSDDLTVSMLGIYGLGGIGKTEIAKALYNKIVHKFEAAIFIANVREKSNRINGLEELQMALLSNMSEVLEIELSSTSRGIYEIKRRLGKKKVLLVLDDVNDREQLNKVHLTSLDVSDCRELQKIPKYTHLRILNVNLCLNLEEISELPPTIQKVYARYCRSLTPETLDMLWSQVKKEIVGLEVVMCQIKTPEWFDWSDNGGNPCFWCRGKFPILALALVFNNERGTTYDLYHHHQFVELHLVINGQCVPQKGSYNFRMEVEHVLVCDLRLLFSEEEWLGLDAHMVHDWNLVQVSYEASSTMTLSSWGVYVYKQETKMEDVRFKCPDPECPDTSSPTAVVVPMLSMEAHEGTAEAPPPPTVAPSSGDDDPLLQALMIMKKDESCESEAKSKLYWKLIQEHKSLRKKFEQLENQSIAARDELDSWKHQYHDLLEQLNTTQFDSKFALRDSGKEGGKKHEKVAATVLKGRGEELRELYDAEIEGFQKSQESHDLMSVVYLKGVRDGVLEAQATLLALDMDKIATLEERVTRDVEEEEAHNHIEEQHDITHEDADHDSGISSPADSQVDNPGETSYLP